MDSEKQRCQPGDFSKRGVSILMEGPGKTSDESVTFTEKLCT